MLPLDIYVIIEYNLGMNVIMNRDVSIKIYFSVVFVNLSCVLRRFIGKKNQLLPVLLMQHSIFRNNSWAEIIAKEFQNMYQTPGGRIRKSKKKFLSNQVFREVLNDEKK